MRLLLTVLLFIGPTSHAGFKDFCYRHLIADDPFPYAEFNTRELFHVWDKTKDRKVLKELVFRLRSGLMTDHEIGRFWMRFK